jgi:cell division protein FtsW
VAIVSPLRGLRRQARRTTSASAPRRGARAVSSWTAALRDALERPLTSYYLLLGAAALLLTIGLIMVFSASSVYAF